MPPTPTQAALPQLISNLINEFFTKLREVSPSSVFHVRITHQNALGGEAEFQGGNASDAIKLYFSQKMREEVVAKIRFDIMSPQTDFTPRKTK